MNKDIKFTKNTESKLSELDFDNIPFGNFFADYMFVADYKNGEWTNLSIEPFGRISISPSCSALHYGQALFEGMKAYKDRDGNAVLFRPDENISRLNISAHRLGMPEIPAQLFKDALMQLIAINADWVPPQVGSSLYIRPFMFANEEFVGIKVAQNYKFMIFCCPVGKYYSRPVKVTTSDKYVRAFEGGVGFSKAAGNYGAAMLPLKEVQAEGFDQVLWTDGSKENPKIHEIGTMNVFFVIDGKVITPSTDEGTILKGITRKSILELLKAKGYEVEVRDVYMNELIEGYKNGTFTEAFGAGTAATIAHICQIHHFGTNMDLVEENQTISNFVKKSLEDIRYGMSEDEFNWMQQVPSAELV